MSFFSNDPCVVVFDLETKRSFQEVGGREGMSRLGVSLAVAAVLPEENYLVFRERELRELKKLLDQAEMVVGFNIVGFDFKVLSGELGEDVSHPNVLDLMLELEWRLGFRPSLESVASATLGEGKSAKGLDAIKWWREGRLDLIERYCRKDVELVVRLLRVGMEEGKLWVRRKDDSVVEVPVSWRPPRCW